MSNYLPGEGIRDVNVKDSGNDDNNGSNVIFAVRTLDRASDLVSQLVPAPDLFNPASIIDPNASSYDAPFIIPDNVQLGLQFSRLTLPESQPAATALTAGSNSQASLLSIVTSITSGDIGYSTDSNTRLNLDAKAIVCNGEGQTGYSASGVSSEIFCDVGQILMRGDNSIAASYTADGDGSTSLAFNEINLEGINSTGVFYSSVSDSVSVINVASITDTGGAGNVAITVEDGHVACNVNEIDCETAIVVENGATLDVFNAHIGNCKIIVNTGGTLNINAITYGGDFDTDIVEDGVINGTIGGKSYGNAETSGTDTVSGDDTLLNSNYKVVGRLSLNTEENKIVNIISYLSKGSGITGSSGVRVMYSNLLDNSDPKNGEIYFTGDITRGDSGSFAIGLIETATPIPIQESIYLEVQAKESGAGLTYYSGTTMNYKEV